MDEYTNGARGITPLDPISLGFLHSIWSEIPEQIFIFDLRPRYYIILFFCLIAIYVSLSLRDGKLGRAWIAIREDELAAGAMGIPLMRTKLWAYAVGAFFGGLGGVFYAADQSAVFPTSFFFNISILILCMVILGGMGNVWGVILGASLLAWLNYKGLAVIGTAFNSAAGTDINVPDKSFLIFGIILVVMMLLRPEGLLPAARQKALIHEEIDESTGRRPYERGRGRNVLEVTALRRTFGGLVGRQRRRLRDPRALHRLPDRAERGGQDDVLQHPHGPVRAHDRQRAVQEPRRQGAGDHRPAAAPHRAARHVAHVPEHPPVLEHDRAGERARRAAPAPQGRPLAHAAAHAGPAPRGAGGARPRLRDPAVRRAGAPRATRPRATCPTATSAGSRSPAPWRWSRRCSSSTSRPPA